MKRWSLVAAISLGAVLPAVAEPAGPTLTLDEALKAALANHPQLRASHAQTEASQARVGQAKAGLLPQVNATASYQRATLNYIPQPGALPKSIATDTSTGTQTSTSVSPGNSSAWDTGSSYRGSVTASELIYDFGQTSGRWSAAKASLRSQEQTERNTTVQLAFTVRSAYYNAAAARALVKVAEETLGNQDAHLRQIQGFVEAGTRPEIDLAQARTDRANARVQLINAEVNYGNDKVALNQAMGVERGTDYDVAEPPLASVAGEDDPTEALLPTALAARPDLLALARQVEAQEATTKSIKGTYAPSLGVSTGFSGGGVSIDDPRWNWNAMLTLNWQIYGGGITQAQVRESEANTAALRAQYELLRQQVRADVEQARLSVRAAKAAIEAAHEAAANARIRLGLAEGRYRAGVGNVIELGDAQLALTTAAAQEVQAVFNLAAARAKLLEALGQP
jgi:outer membrane protein